MWSRETGTKKNRCCWPWRTLVEILRENKCLRTRGISWWTITLVLEMLLGKKKKRLIKRPQLPDECSTENDTFLMMITRKTVSKLIVSSFAVFKVDTQKWNTFISLTHSWNSCLPIIKQPLRRRSAYCIQHGPLPPTAPPQLFVVSGQSRDGLENDSLETAARMSREYCSLKLSECCPGTFVNELQDLYANLVKDSQFVLSSSREMISRYFCDCLQQPDDHLATVKSW